MSRNSMASTLYVVSDGVSGPPGFGAIGGPPGWPPTGFNGCCVCATVTTGAIAVTQAKAAAAHACANGWYARSAALGPEVRPGAVMFPVMRVFCVMAAGYLTD